MPDESGDITLTFKLKNAGSRKGAESVQTYVSYPDSSEKLPFQRLAAFAKAELQPGEEKEMEMKLPSRTFAFFDEKAGKFMNRRGKVLIRVGSSSRDIRLEREIIIG